MADPLTLSAIGIGGSLLGGLTGAAGAAQTAAAQQQMYNYQAGLAQINAQIALQNADYARQQGEQQAQQYGMQAGQRMGQIITSQASSGLDINTGSNKLVQQSQQLVTGLDLDQIRSNAAKTAYDYDTQSVQYQDQAQLYRMGGANAAAAGAINITSSILGTAASVSTKWLQGQQYGLPGNISLGGSPTTAMGLGQ